MTLDLTSFSLGFCIGGAGFGLVVFFGWYHVVFTLLSRR